MRVALIGASGFLGSEAWRTLSADPDLEVVPFARSTGNSWELLRQGITPRRLDLMDPTATVEALKGFDAIANCSRTSGPDMAPTMRNLLAAAKANGVRRLVHISSVAIYGDPPAPEAATEAALPAPNSNYGRFKLGQDRLVEEAAREGLGAVILCPPNITGPGSGFLCDALDALRVGQLPLVEEGRLPLSTVDVGNLAHAIACALKSDAGGGRRFFITDPGPVTWADLVAELAQLPPPFPAPGAIDRATLAAMRDALADPEPSLGKAVGRLISGDVRKALIAEPWWAARLGAAKKLVGGLPPIIAEPLKAAISKPASVPRRHRWAGINARLVSQQLRGVAHSSAAAEAELGYRPPWSFARSMAAFRRWHGTLRPPAFEEGLPVERREMRRAA
ncbi:MAG: NAD-dependent epimerase/dehydratase family protein [Sphingomonadaceae bacterium]